MNISSSENKCFTNKRRRQPLSDDELEGQPPRRIRRPDADWERLVEKVKMSWGFCCCVAFVLLLLTSVTLVPAGSVGVCNRFGAVLDDVLEPGLHFVLPITSVIPMSTRYQTITYSEDVPTAEGLDIHLEAAAIVHLDPERAVEVYKHIGQDYLNLVVVPQFRSVLRAITSAHNAKDLYTASAREAMTVGLQDDLKRVLQPYGIMVNDTPLKKLELPSRLLTAIQDKLAAEQASETMQFVLSKSRQEAEQQVIIAEGIAQYQKIIGTQLQEHTELLTWKGIEATERLAQSANSKVVMIGSGGTGGLPIMFDPTRGLLDAPPTAGTQKADDVQWGAASGKPSRTISPEDPFIPLTQRELERKLHELRY